MNRARAWILIIAVMMAGSNCNSAGDSDSSYDPPSKSDPINVDNSPKRGRAEKITRSKKKKKHTPSDGEVHFREECSRLQAENEALHEKVAKSENDVLQAEHDKERAEHDKERAEQDEKNLLHACAQHRKHIRELETQRQETLEGNAAASLHALRIPAKMVKLNPANKEDAEILDAMQKWLVFDPVIEAQVGIKQKCQYDMPMISEDPEHGHYVSVQMGFLYYSDPKYLSARQSQFVGSSMATKPLMTCGNPQHPVSHNIVSEPESQTEVRAHDLREAITKHYQCFAQCLNPVGRDCRLLLHGPSDAGLGKMIEEGWNRAFIGPNGQMFGKGAYFSPKIGKVNQYIAAATRHDVQKTKLFPGFSPDGHRPGEQYVQGQFLVLLFCVFTGDTLLTRTDTTANFATDAQGQLDKSCLRPQEHGGRRYDSMLVQTCNHPMHISGRCPHGCSLKSYEEWLIMAQDMCNGGILLIGGIVFYRNGPFWQPMAAHNID